MHRTDADGAVDGLHVPGSLTPPLQEATVIGSDWLNAVQEEICNVVEAHTPLVKADNTQLLTVLTTHYGRLGSANTWTAKNTFDLDGDGWQTLPLHADWTDFNVSATGPHQYRVDSFGRCWIRGDISKTGTSSTLAVLPAAAVPAYTVTFLVPSTSSSGFSTVQIAGASTGASAGYMSLLVNDANRVRLHGIAFYVNGK
ncbi:hypothetical protein [Archangium lansingense]|uniref:Uncharacterized protein n=1 Tax=Archangium lansingense TaxID=2995310 RepID=A0ABT4AC27_9BACT|nr:hypothetical protein [Archangium lansinium]MCY1078876.1 hypothetical protein [Archangium lansinium]